MWTPPNKYSENVPTIYQNDIPYKKSVFFSLLREGRGEEAIEIFQSAWPSTLEVFEVVKHMRDYAKNLTIPCRFNPSRSVKMDNFLSMPKNLEGFSSEYPKYASDQETKKHAAAALKKLLPRMKFTVSMSRYSYCTVKVVGREILKYETDIKKALKGFISEKYDASTDSTNYLNPPPYEVDGVWFRPSGKCFTFMNKTDNTTLFSVSGHCC